MLLMIVVKLTPYFRLFGLPHSLQERKATQWGDAVQLVFSDMRSFTPSVQADIIVSELLGSFGDNELSPEWVPERPFVGRQARWLTLSFSSQMPRRRHAVSITGRHLHPVLLHLLPSANLVKQAPLGNSKLERPQIPGAALRRHVPGCADPERGRGTRELPEVC